MRFGTVVCLLLLLFTCPDFLEAKHTYGNLYVLKVDRVHDGDTFIAEISDVHPIIGKEISIRINGIDTPEITDKRPAIKELAIKARDYVQQRLLKSCVIELINVQRDKYFRLLADVYVDGVNLADELIRAGLAKPYDGKTKPEW
jgi:endonuclease YncB( thermonuclease family)